MSVEYPEGGTQAPHSSFHGLFYLVFLGKTMSRQTGKLQTGQLCQSLPKMQRRKLEGGSSLFNFLFCLASPVLPLPPDSRVFSALGSNSGGAWLPIPDAGNPSLTPDPLTGVLVTLVRLWPPLNSNDP